MLVSPKPCNFAKNTWVYKDEPPPPAEKIPDGLYTIKNVATSKFLHAEKGSQSVSLSDTATTTFFFFTKSNGSTGLYTIFKSQDYQPYAVLSQDKNSNLMISVFEDDTPFLIHLLQDGSIFSPKFNTYYAPVDGKIKPQATPERWEFTSVPCVADSRLLDTGLYTISTKMFNTNTTIYLTVDTNTLLLTNTEPTDTTWKKYIWNYSDIGGGLSNCGKFLSYDPNTMKFSLSDEKSLLGVDNNQIFVQDLLVANMWAGELHAWACGSEGSAFTFTPLNISLPASIPSGNYQLQLTDEKGVLKCLNKDGSLDTTCDEKTSYWTYNSEAKTLQNISTGKCLINTTSDICNIQDLQMGECTEPNAARFILGQDGSLVDSTLGFCYNPVVAEGFRMTASSSEDDKKNKKTLLAVLLGIGIPLFIIIIIVAFASKKKSKYQ